MTNDMKRPVYFAMDGSYGHADRLFITDVEEWTDADWLEIEEAGDYGRLMVAFHIAKKYQKELSV